MVFQQMLCWISSKVPLSAQRMELVYLDCRPDVLHRRFSETRRRHPAAPAEGPAIGIARRLTYSRTVRDRADFLIDTSDMSLHDLRAEIDRLFGGRAKAALQSASSLSPTSAACRAASTSFLIAVFCAIPIGMTCCAPAMVAIRTWRPTSPKTPATPRSFERVNSLMDLVLPAHVEEGKSHLSIGFGCTGGKHRSVCVTQALASTLAENGWQVSIHRSCPGVVQPEPRLRAPRTHRGSR